MINLGFIADQLHLIVLALRHEACTSESPSYEWALKDMAADLQRVINESFRIERDRHRWLADLKD